MINLLNANIHEISDLIIYGNGSAASKMEKYYESQGKNILYFCYSNAKGEGETHHGKRVLNLRELFDYCEKNKDVYIQIASTYEQEILDDLRVKNINATLLLENDFKYFIRSNQLEYIGKSGDNYRRESIKDYAYERKYFARRLAWDQLSEYNLSKDTVNMILGCPKTGTTSVFESFLNMKGKLNTPVYVSYSMQCFSQEQIDVIRNAEKRILGGVREPISQMISMFFFLWYTRLYLFDDKNKFKDIEDLQYWFDEHFVKDEKKDENAFEIFCDIMMTTCNEIDFYEKEYKNCLGIDLFDYKFDKEKGYAIIESGNTEIFIYRLDKLNSLESRIGEFFGVSEFQLISSNRSEDRVYRELYKEAMSKIKIKKEFLDKCYNSKLIRWCYTDTEIEQFREKWKDNIIL